MESRNMTRDTPETLMVASGRWRSRMNIHAKHAGCDLERHPADTPFFPVSAGYQMIAFEARTHRDRMEFMSLVCLRPLRLVRDRAFGTRPVYMTHRKRQRIQEAHLHLLIQLRYHLKRKQVRPISTDQGWDGHPRQHRQLVFKPMKDHHGPNGI